MHLGRGRYPNEITVVDEGTPAHRQGLPPNSLMVSVNGQPLEPNDGEDVKDQVKEMRKQRPVTFDVVTFDDLIDLQTAEEQETKRRIDFMDLQTVEEQETIRRVVRKFEHLQRAFTNYPPKGAATE